MQVNRKDCASGAFFIATGLFYGAMTWVSLPMGRPLNMGPGYFPAVLALILIALGGYIVGRSFFIAQRSPFGVVPWRGIIMLSLSTIVFAAFVEDLGLAPGVFATAFLAALASPKVQPHKAALISACIAAFCTLVFAYGIKLPIPVLGPWFSFLGIAV